LAAGPNHFRARLLLAHSLLSDARMADAEAELLICQGLRPDRVEPLVGLATCAVERGDREQARARLERALALDPSSTLALQEQGNLYLRDQRYDLAGPVFQRVVRLDPRDKQAHLKLAQVLRQQGDPEGARKHEEAYRELDQEESQQSKGRGMR